MKPMRESHLVPFHKIKGPQVRYNLGVISNWCFNFVEHFQVTLSHMFCEMFHQEPLPTPISFNTIIHQLIIMKTIRTKGKQVNNFKI